MHRFRKAGMSVAAVALAVSGVAVLMAGPASAKGGSTAPKGKTTCTSITGTASTTVTLGGCTSTGTPGTGGSSMTIPTATLVAGGPVTWSNGDVTTFGPPSLSVSVGKHCPGYIKGTKKAPYTGAEPSLDKFSRRGDLR